MPIKYVGRTTTYKGKSLWEILGNLKNHGVGRMVIRSKQQRYPESSYLRILKVAALPNTVKNPHESRNVAVLVERTFRGATLAYPLQMDETTYKADYILIPKDQEHIYLNRTERPEQRIMARTTDFPPLLKELIIRQAKQKKEEPKLQMKIVYNTMGIKNYRVAEEGETPTVTVSVGLGKPASPKLYENLKEIDS